MGVELNCLKEFELKEKKEKEKEKPNGEDFRKEKKIRIVENGFS